MNIDQIISKLFSNSASKEDLLQLEEWKKEGSSNIDALSGMEEIWNDTESLKDYKEFDSDKAWNKLNSHMVDQALKTPIPKRPIIRRMLPFAASLLILISALFVFQTIDFTKDKLIQYTALDIIEHVILSDNSSLSIDKNSSVVLLSDFTKERILKAEGRILFKVNSTNTPFVVKTYHGDIVVTGTTFSVNTRKSETQIYLKEGSISFRGKNKLIKLKPSEGLLVKENGEISKYRENSPNIMSWERNTLVFNDQYISKIFDALSDHFNIKFILNVNSIDTNCKISTSFKSLDLKQILSELSEIFDMNYKINDDSVIISHLSC